MDESRDLIIYACVECGEFSLMQGNAIPAKEMQPYAWGCNCVGEFYPLVLDTVGEA